MRTLMRIEVDPSRPVDLSHLKGMQRITVAIRYRFINSELYKKYKNKENDKQLRIDAIRREKLKNVLLYNLTTRFKEKSKIQSITLFVDRSFEDILPSVIDSMDFSNYTIYKKKENPDVLFTQPDLKICLICERRQYNLCRDQNYNEICLTKDFLKSS